MHSLFQTRAHSHHLLHVLACRAAADKSASESASALADREAALAAALAAAEDHKVRRQGGGGVAFSDLTIFKSNARADRGYDIKAAAYAHWRNVC